MSEYTELEGLLSEAQRRLESIAKGTISKNEYRRIHGVSEGMAERLWDAVCRVYSNPEAFVESMEAEALAVEAAAT